MTKITKKEYDFQMNNLKDSLQVVQDTLQHLKQKYENNIGQYEIDYSENVDYWNDLHDLQYEIEKEIRLLDDKWDTRNWTQQDWNEHELVSMNID
ncbi:MAG: hypothetical protein ACRDD7_08495 [Peptostreptococcaceae bacterium]